MTFEIAESRPRGRELVLAGALSDGILVTGMRAWNPSVGTGGVHARVVEIEQFPERGPGQDIQLTLEPQDAAAEPDWGAALRKGDVLRLDY
ncbi:MAG: hypothetical protein R3E98_14135 [Gemmatimonadota bacterium]